MSLDILFPILVTTFVLSGAFVFFIIGKNDQINQMHLTLAKLKKSFQELDEQAKLIVKTDLELNKAQEQLDKRLHSLNALQKISRLISTTLEEDEIFSRLQEAFQSEVSFEKHLILFFDNEHHLHHRVAVGFSEPDIPQMISSFEKSESLIRALKEGNILSSLNSPKIQRDAINRLFDVEHFVISPILTKNGLLGIIFIGNLSNAEAITEGDEELVSILGNQIGQSLENARLFEEVYKTSQSLEVKVFDRTKQLASALEEVKKISKTKSDFISAVSHELRTPLTSIKGYASLLMSGKLGDIPDAVKQRMEKINLHSDSLVKLINDLLDISRIESGRVEMSIGKYSLSSITDAVADLLTPQMKDKNIQWKVDLDQRLPMIMLDRGQVERVFINLVNNAIKFTPPKGTISVTAALTREEATGLPNIVTVEVADTGIGIKEEDIDKLFNEFYRVDNEINQNVKGTGLGLSLAKKIVEAHGGKMWVKSKVNGGTTFSFTLPLTQDKQPAAPVA